MHTDKQTARHRKWSLGGRPRIGNCPPAFYLVCALRRCFTIFKNLLIISMCAVRRKGEQGGPAMSACMCAPKRRPPSPERGLPQPQRATPATLSPAPREIFFVLRVRLFSPLFCSVGLHAHCHWRCPPCLCHWRCPPCIIRMYLSYIGWCWFILE
jgi:hypothetical protein